MLFAPFWRIAKILVAPASSQLIAPLQACITEDQKYQGKLYKEKKPKGQHQKKDSAQHDNSQALTTHNAYVEDAREGDNAVAIVDAPPRAPTPPPAPHSLGYHEQAALEAPNVFDFLDASETPNVPKTYRPVDESRMLEDSQPPAYKEEQTPKTVDVMNFQVADDDEDFAQNGFAYGTEPLRPTNERFDSYTTPAPKSKHSRTKSRDTDVETTTKKTDRKRKRKSSPTELDMSLVRAQDERDVMMADAPPMLHSGLTGGLNRLLARPEFPPSPEDSGDYANSPLSPMKRAKQGNSKALMRAQREWEKQQQNQRKNEIEEERAREKEEKKDKERGRERDRKERKASTALVKIRPKKKRDESTKEIRRIRRRQYSSSVSPPPRERKALKAIEYNRSASNSPGPDDNGQLVVRPNGELAPHATAMDARAELFMSFITKGPESERGMSVNKALKRYHRERYDRYDRVPSKAEEEKELWKDLRLKRNDRGEIVLFFATSDES
jgi:cell growth-regulating nucleolar protein